MIQELFNKRRETISDINEHMDTLRALAAQCHSVTEFGVRDGNSTISFMASGCPQVTSYDINYSHIVDTLKPYGLLFHQADSSLPVDLKKTDMLFIDTLHTYSQVVAELKSAKGKVNKFIAFHDTVLFGINGEQGQEGINRAIDEFIKENPEWKVYENYINNNGLLILTK